MMYELIAAIIIILACLILWPFVRVLEQLVSAGYQEWKQRGN